jgi:hypothetical protein
MPGACAAVAVAGVIWLGQCNYASSLKARLSAVKVAAHELSLGAESYATDSGGIYPEKVEHFRQFMPPSRNRESKPLLVNLTIPPEQIPYSANAPDGQIWAGYWVCADRKEYTVTAGIGSDRLMQQALSNR